MCLFLRPSIVISLLGRGRDGDKVSNQRPSFGGGFPITDTYRLKASGCYTCHFQRCPKTTRRKRAAAPSCLQPRRSGTRGHRLSFPAQPPSEQREAPREAGGAAGCHSGGQRPLTAAAIVTAFHGQGRAEPLSKACRTCPGACWEKRRFPLIPSASERAARRTEPPLLPFT